MPRRALEISVQSQKLHRMANAQLCDQSVDRCKLHAGSPAAIAQLGGVDRVNCGRVEHVTGSGLRFRRAAGWPPLQRLGLPARL